MTHKKQYWLFKSEPTCYSIDDLRRDNVEHWDGIRNYQVRNMLRDDIHIGDDVIFYHSSCKVPGAVGTAKVVSEGYPDHTAFDPDSEHPDPKSDPKNPRWFMVDVQYKSHFKNIVSLSMMRDMHELEGMQLLKKGNRLSILPLTKDEYEAICAMGR